MDDDVQKDSQADKWQESAKNDPYRTRATLIRRVRNQYDHQSWEEFERIYRGFIFSLIRQMNIDQHDAEDISQQVLIKVWKKIPDLKSLELSRFRSWLSTVTKNCVIDFVRKRKSNSEMLKRNRTEQEIDYLSGMSASEVEELSDRLWRNHLTQMALSNIAPLFSGKAMDVFELTLEGMDSQAIADKLDLKVKSVYRLRLRVKDKLIEEVSNLRESLE